MRIARTVPEVEELRETWTSWPGHRDSDIDLFLEIVRTRPEVLHPHVIVISKDGQPDAILIGRVERTRLNSKIGYLRLPGIPVRTITFVYGGFRGSVTDENAAHLIESILNSLQSGDADTAFFHELDAESTLYRLALKMPGLNSRDHLTKPKPHYLIRLPQTVDELYQSFSRNLRSQLRQRKKKLLKQFEGNIQIKRAAQPEEFDALIPDIERVAQKTYQRGLGVGFDNSPAVRARLELFAQKGWLRTYVLYLADVPCSFWTGTVYDGVFLSEYMGYDPAFQEHSVGMFVIITTLENLCEHGVKEADFGIGAADYKERFSNRHLMEYSVHIFAPNLKGAALNAVYTAAGMADRTIRSALERTQLLPKVKKLWRRRVSAPTAPPPVASQE